MTSQHSSTQLRKQRINLMIHQDSAEFAVRMPGIKGIRQGVSRRVNSPGIKRAAYGAGARLGGAAGRGVRAVRGVAGSVRRNPLRTAAVAAGAYGVYRGVKAATGAMRRPRRRSMRQQVRQRVGI
jgi:hypothetical protein